jgi:hypothetical protein
MTSIDKVSSALSEWVFYVAKSVLPKFTIPENSAIGKFMYGIMGVNPSSYNIWNELGFLAEPMIESLVTPMIGKYLQGIPDEQVKDISMKFVDAFIARTKEKGSVNLFGLELGEDAFSDLKVILTSKFEEE